MAVTDAELDDALLSRLRLLDEMRGKLLYVRWGRESMVLLSRVVHDIAQMAAATADRSGLADSARQLEEIARQSVAEGGIPRGATREHLLQRIREVVAHLPAGAGEATPARADTASAGTASPVAMLAGPWTDLLGRRLELLGLDVVRHKDIDGLRTWARHQSASALLVDLDLAPGDPAEWLAEVRRVTGSKAKVFCLAERGDLDSRLAAVHNGADGYFVKPVHVPRVLESITAALNVGAGRGGRVLIVPSKAEEGRAMARVLDARGFMTHTVSPANQVLQSVHRLQPQVVLVDLDLADPDGAELARVLRQHEYSDSMNLVLLASSETLDKHRDLVLANGFDVIAKPWQDTALAAAVNHRFRRLQQVQQRLTHLARHDTASGLLSRRYFLERLGEALNAAQGRADKQGNLSPVALLLVRLERLRELDGVDVNLTDQIVAEAARRLQFALGPGYQSARLADDVFAVIIPNAYKESVLATARAVRTAMVSEAYAQDGESVMMQVNIGVSMTGDDLKDVNTLIQRADLASSSARGDEDGIHLHETGKSGEDESQYHIQRLLEEVGNTVKQQRLSLVFQPIVSLTGDTGARYEALLRLKNHEGRDLLPETVFSIAQHHRVGMVLDRWVITQAMRLLRDRDQNGQVVTLFINVSAALFSDTQMLDWLGTGLERAGIRPEQLVFELSEAALATAGEAAESFIRRVRALGCGVSIKRFGGSPEGVERAAELGVTYVKTDMGLVDGLASDPDRQRRLGDMTRNLRAYQVELVAAWVEDSTQLSTLWQCGVRLAQGYFLQRPGPDMDYDFADAPD